MRRPPRLLDWLTSLLLLGGLAVSAAPRAAEAQQGTVVRDPYYGEVLFHFYKQDDFTALTHLLAARDAGRVEHHEAEAELLLGGLYLSYGQHDHAAGIFERLLAQTEDKSGDQANGNGRDKVQSESVRDRAWFYLGKLRYQRGLYPDALQALSRIGKSLPEALAAELPMLVAQCHMATGDFDGAQRVLASWDAPDSWLSYARYNLGVALVRLDRVPEGAQLLDRVGRMDAETAEQKNLRDKANLALGYAYLQKDDALQAKLVLQRVRLQGPFANKALLGAGWADAIGGDFRSALTPWLELGNRDLMDSAVQESFLAVPYAFGHLDVHGSAVERYQKALGAFDAEIEQIDSAMGRARSGAFLPAMLDGDEPELGRWYWRLKKVPDSDDSRFLYHLLADHSFQEGFKNYRDLSALVRNLDDWRERLETFSAMVDARRSAYAQRVPAAEQRLAGVDVAALRARRDALQQKLAAAESSRDVAAVATADEQAQWRRLAVVEGDSQFAAAEGDLRARHRLLKGVLAWEFDRQFKRRVAAERKSLRELQGSIDAADARLVEIRAAQAAEPRRFDEFAARIAALTPRILAMQASIDGTLARQEDTLVAMSVRELGAQKERLASYRVQARFALAAIYDRAGAAQTAATETAP